MARRGRAQGSSVSSQGQGVQQGPTFVDARSIQSIQVGVPPQLAQQTAFQFADSVRNATIAEAELRHNQTVDEVRRASTQLAREEVMAEAESRHQHVVQDLARASMEHAQNVSARVASDVRTEVLAEAESRHQQILRETVEQANRIHAQSLDDVRCQAHSNMIGQSNHPVTFSTGGGVGTDQILAKLWENFLVQECYLLKNSPWALSIGDQVRKGKAFVWLPRDSADVSEDAGS